MRPTLRGPVRSAQVPRKAAASPSTAMAMLKMMAICSWFQSPGADWVMPSRRVSGILKTLSAYTCPMHMWMASAAGGTSQRL